MPHRSIRPGNQGVIRPISIYLLPE